MAKKPENDLLMPQSEIVQMFREGKNKEKMLEVLADMNCTTRSRIARVLEANGLEVAKPYGKGKKKVKEDKETMKTELAVVEEVDTQAVIAALDIAIDVTDESIAECSQKIADIKRQIQLLGDELNEVMKERDELMKLDERFRKEVTRIGKPAV